MVSFGDFKALDLRVGTILEAVELEGSAKLYKLTVKADKERTLLAGLKGFYSLEELKGKQVVLLVNLEPKKIMGVESQGMLLAAVEGTGPEQKISLIEPDKAITPGSGIE